MSFQDSYRPQPHYVDPAVFQRADTARNTQRAADAAEATDERIARMVDAMETQLELAKASQATAERTERFARGMAWASLIVSVASLGAAVAAIVVSVTLGT